MSIPSVDLGQLVQTLLYLLFAGLTAIISAVIGPTYDNLLVPELQPASLFPPMFGPGNGANYLSTAARFSGFVLSNVVDPAVALVALGVALLYLARSVVSRWADQMDGLIPRLILGVVGANFTVPIAGAILGVAGGLYPVISGWDGGAWQHWVNLAGWGEISFSWDNGALAFVLSFVEFALVFALILAIGIRDAVLAVLLVLLPIFTLLWPLRPLSPLARRGWLLFGELAFLPCVLVVPLELAVGSPNPVMLVSYLAVALASPYFLSLAGTHLVTFGSAGASGVLHSNAQRGLQNAPTAATSSLGPLAIGARTTGSGGSAIGGAVRTAGSTSAPAAVPLVIANLLGHGGRHIVEHFGKPPQDHPSANEAPFHTGRNR
ncbi:MAG TPA: hypothetical protein VEH28_08485 [Thermoplasmata archaeon]|nr:hypothetical protein [Thermoplasmata archaeon]